MIEALLSPDECDALAGLYPKDDIFRSRIMMNGTVSGVASTSILAIRCRILLRRFAQLSTRT